MYEMIITIKSSTNVSPSCSLTRLIQGNFYHCIQQNINENSTHLYHANSENWVHNIVVSILSSSNCFISLCHSSNMCSSQNRWCLHELQKTRPSPALLNGL